MASITIKNEEVELIVKPGGYTLDLSQQEAEVLAAVLSKFGGNPSRSHRKYAQRISSALREVGIKYQDTEAYKSLKDTFFDKVESLSEDF